MSQPSIGRFLRVPLASSGLESEDIEAAISVLRSGSLTMGERVKAFEQAMAEYLQVDHFIMTNSGSSANLAIVESLVRPTKGEPMLHAGDGVLLPAVAWPTTVWPILQLGLRPVFVDVNPDTIMIDLEAAARAVAQAHQPIRAIFPIHPLGRAMNHSELRTFCDVHDLLLISDTCEALGAWVQNVHAGTTSLAASFSFYFSHHITTMEGGGVATNDAAIADDLRSIRSHGWSRDRQDVASWITSQNDVNSRFLFVSAGYNIRPMEIQASIGIGQIRRIDEYITRRRSIARHVAEAVANSSLSLLGADTLLNDPKSHSWMLLPFRATSPDAAKQIVRGLELAGIETRPILTGNFTAQPALARLLDEVVLPSDFPGANVVSTECFMVGCHHHFADSQVEHLAEILRNSGT